MTAWICQTIMALAVVSCSQNTKSPSYHYTDNTLGLYINEVMSSSESACFDEEGRPVEFIELINTSDAALDISAFGLSDNSKWPPKFTFPKGTVIEPSGFAVVRCSKKYSKDEAGLMRAPFSISPDKDTLFLSDNNGGILDAMIPASTPDNWSFIRIDSTTFRQSANITPGYPNTLAGARAYRASASIYPKTGVYISEVLPHSENAWIEIYNSSDTDVNIAGYSLSKKVDKPGKFVFPDFPIPAKSRKVIIVGVDAKTLSTGFNLHQADGLFFFDKSESLIDVVNLSSIKPEHSIGRDDSTSVWKYFSTPTRGASNSKGFIVASDKPVPSIAPGIYNGVDTMIVTLDAEGAVFYTLDGSAPSMSSKRYSEPLQITGTTCLRAVSYADDALPSDIASFSYIVNENNTLDVVSIVGDNDDFYSASRGIFHGQEEDNAHPTYAPNFWRNWKRQVNVSFFPLEGEGFSEDAALSVFGGWTRMNGKKSMKLKFKDIYGPHRLKYRLFENRDRDEYDAFVLRCGGQDTYGSMMKDDLAAVLLDSVIDVMATRLAVVYINGTYKGIYHIREKVNEHFVAAHYNIPSDSVNMIKSSLSTEIGSISGWKSLLAYVRSHDLSKPECFKYVADRVNLQNCADFVIAEVYCDNNDPGNNRCFNTPYLENGKWHWIFYDVDMGFNGATSTCFHFFLYPTMRTLAQTDLIRGLLKNDEFRTIFLDRLEYQMHNVWNTERVLAAIDQMAAEMDGEVDRNNALFGAMNRNRWETRVEALRKCAKGRQAFLKKCFGTDPQLKSLLHMTQEELDRCFESEGK